MAINEQDICKFEMIDGCPRLFMPDGSEVPGVVSISYSKRKALDQATVTVEVMVFDGFVNPAKP